MSKKRWMFFTLFVLTSLGCGLSIFRLGAANPTSGTIGPNTTPLQWTGTAAGGASNGESTCVEGVNCDTFTLTVTGTPADWSGKQIQVAMTWVVLANDYDLFIHRGDNNGPIVAQSTHSAPSTSEMASIEPGDLDPSGATVFTVHVTYFTGSAADAYHCTASVVTASATGPTPTPPPISSNWKLNFHGECCEGNLAAAGNNTYVLLPVLVNGNKILKSSDGGQNWTRKYPPVDVSVPFGIEGDMQAFGNDVIFFGTELATAIVAHSDDAGETFTVVQNPLLSAGNDQAWAYLGPLSNMRPGGALPTDEPYVLAGWMRIGSVVAFSFDGGLTFPLQTPLVGDDGSGPVHVVCRNSAHAPNDIGDTRVPNADFAKHKAGRHGTWGTDRKFYWTEPADNGTGGRDLYVCKTDNFGVTWTGIKHPAAPGPGSDFVVSHSTFDNKGTLYVLHGDKLYVSFNQGESFAFVHTLPRYGSARLSDAGSDQALVADCGTAHIAIMEGAGGGNGNVYYLRGSHVDTANPVWDEELVDVVGNNRLDFIYIVLDGNGIPTISYTRPGQEVTTASRNSAPLSIASGPCGASVSPISAVSRKTHGAAGTFDVNLVGLSLGIEPRSGGPNGNHQIVVTFGAPVSLGSVTTSCGTVANSSASSNTVTVNLTGVANATQCDVTLHGVNDGSNVGDVAIPVAFLEGDATADRFVNSADISLTKSQSGTFPAANTFRADYNTDGFINSADIALVKSRSGTGLPAQPATSPTGVSSSASPNEKRNHKREPRLIRTKENQ